MPAAYGQTAEAFKESRRGLLPARVIFRPGANTKPGPHPDRKFLMRSQLNSAMPGEELNPYG